jgi:hypothetical protein
MKLTYVLPVLIALPMGAFADSHIRPFIGYDFSLVVNTNMKIKYQGDTIIKNDSFSFNDDNVGSFGLGVEFGDIMAVYVTPVFNRVKIKEGPDTTTMKTTEIDAAFNFYLTRGSNFKPFVSLNAGYINMDDDETVKASGATFGANLGCKQYMNDNVYLFASAGYKFSTKMDVKKYMGASMSDMDLKMSGFDLSIGAGYRF